MEQKLKEFKNRRRRESLMNAYKNFVCNVLEKLSYKKKEENAETQRALDDALSNQNSSISSKVTFPKSDSAKPSVLPGPDVSTSPMSPRWLTHCTHFLYSLLWTIMYLIAIHLEFGFVFLVLSGLLFIYFNTRTGAKKEGEISAYSVFNPGCTAIQGTLTAEHFEKQFNLIQHDKPSSH